MTRSVRVINLAHAPGEGEAWDRPRLIIYLWAVAELTLVTNPWQISSRIRIAVLRIFGASIGDGVVFRPRTRVKFPWKLSVGERSWIGEGVWIHNQAEVRIGKDVVISQETMMTTGSHAHRKDMALLTRAISIGDGCWITSRCMVLGGTELGTSCLVTPMSVIHGRFAGDTVIRGNPGVVIGSRFEVSEKDAR